MVRDGKLSYFASMISGPLLFLIIFLEGYAVLSTEILALRLIVPFVDSSTDTVAVIVAAVLAPLALGYYAGGQARPTDISRRLALNALVALLFLIPGLSTPVTISFFEKLTMFLGWDSKLLLTAFYAGIFLIVPVFLLGQTVPLLSHYLKEHDLPRATGRMLMVSTAGSLAGALFCPLVLMPFLGVHHAATVTVVSLVLMIVLLRGAAAPSWLAALAGIAMLALNSNYVLERMNIVANNTYHLIEVSDGPAEDMRTMRVNRTMASGIRPAENRSYFPMMQYVEDTFISTYITKDKKLEILVLGAGGFTLGLQDDRNNYTFVDLDPDLKDIAEARFLRQRLGPNKAYYAIPARAFLNGLQTRYDLIFVDLFNGSEDTPEHLVTREFFQQIKGTVRPGGVIVGNFVVSPHFASRLSIRLDNTLRSVFPQLMRQVMAPYNPWQAHNDTAIANVLYIYFDRPGASQDVYTDLKNPSAFDRRRGYFKIMP